MKTDYKFPSITHFQVNRTTMASHQRFEKEVLPVQEFANPKEALKVAEFKAKQLKVAGYNVNITWRDKAGAWRFYKSF